MIIMTILLMVLLVVVLGTVLTVFTGGLALIIAFGDILIFGWLIYIIGKRLMKKRKK